MPLETSSPRLPAASRSGVINTGGAAQDLFPANPIRRGWCVQNQSAADLYVRSRGLDGAALAGPDQNSLKIPAGAYYEAPRITAHAISIYGPTTGQAFFAEEW